MLWRIEFSRESYKFLHKEKLKEEDIFDCVKRAIRKLQGEREAENIDIKKLHGEWQGFFRIRKGKMRIILEFKFEEFAVLVERIDWRGKVYK